MFNVPGAWYAQIGNARLKLDPLLEALQQNFVEMNLIIVATLLSLFCNHVPLDFVMRLI